MESRPSSRFCQNASTSAAPGKRPAMPTMATGSAPAPPSVAAGRCAEGVRVTSEAAVPLSAPETAPASITRASAAAVGLLNRLVAGIG